jgi:sulfur carrier protein ThiS
MKVTLLPQRRTVEFPGSRRVADVLAALELIPGTVMVIRGDALLTDGELVEGDDEIEIRSVISGGAPERGA